LAKLGYVYALPFVGGNSVYFNVFGVGPSLLPTKNVDVLVVKNAGRDTVFLPRHWTDDGPLILSRRVSFTVAQITTIKAAQNVNALLLIIKHNAKITPFLIHFLFDIDLVLSSLVLPG